LNEGFARYFEYVGVDSVHPEWLVVRSARGAARYVNCSKMLIATPQVNGIRQVLTLHRIVNR